MILGILQARVSSSRLPGKVLKPILGVPMLARQLERVSRARRIDELVVATSTQPEDAPIARLCEERAIPCSRGSLDDVLDRFYQAAKPYHPSHVVRLTGDCPLADPTIIDQVIDFCVEGDFDYASNTLRPTWPDGLDVEAMRFEVLERAWSEATLPSEREHVTSFIYGRSALFRLGSLEQKEDLSALRWTVDEPEDFTFASLVYEALYDTHPAFGTEDVLALLQTRPELRALNNHLERNEGYRRSVAGETAENR